MRLRRAPAECRRLKVVFVDHVARLSGGEIALVRLLEAIREDVEAYVLLGEDGPLRTSLQSAGAIVEVLAMSEELREVRRQAVTLSRHHPPPVADFVRYVWRLRRRIREIGPDVVHTNSLKAAVYGGLAARLAGVPVVWHVRDRIADDYLPRPAVMAVRALARLLPSVVVANSQSTLSTLPRRRGTAAARIVPDIAPRPVSDSVRPSCEGRRLRIGMVGRLAPWKGQDVFLEAFGRAFAPGTATAVIVGSALFGEDDYAERLRDLAQRLGVAEDVVWRGFQDDVAAELAQLDILVHASTTPEPFGQVVVEGMAAGLPVIASAAGGPLEIIDSDRDGILVEPGDATQLAAVLRDLAGDPIRRHQLGDRARESSRRFSPQEAKRRLLTTYAAVLRRPVLLTDCGESVTPS